MIKTFKTTTEIKEYMKILAPDWNVFFEEGYVRWRSSSDTYYYLASGAYVVPVVVQTHKIFRSARFVSEPYCYCDNSSESLKDFLNDVVDYAPKLKIDWFDCNLASTMFIEHPDKCEFIPFGNCVVDLTIGEGELFARLHSKHRNVVRKAKKDGLSAKFGGVELIDDYMLMDEKTWVRSNRKSVGRDFYKKCVEDLGKDVFVAISYLDGCPQSGAIIFFNECMGYYMYGCSNSDAHNGAGQYLQWNIMLRLKEMNVKSYSFVGFRINVNPSSKLANIQRFKERFGGELISGYMFKSNINKLKRKLFLQLLKAHGTNYTDPIDEEKSKWVNTD